MAPRKGPKNTLDMADGIESTTVTTAGVTLSAGDLEFLAQCLSHTDGGKVVVSLTVSRLPLPTSSITSRATVSSTVSPISVNPAISAYFL